MLLSQGEVDPLLIQRCSASASFVPFDSACFDLIGSIRSGLDWIGLDWIGLEEEAQIALNQKCCIFIQHFCEILLVPSSVQHVPHHRFRAPYHKPFEPLSKDQASRSAPSKIIDCHPFHKEKHRILTAQTHGASRRQTRTVWTVRFSALSHKALRS